MENRCVSMAFLGWTGIGACAVLVAVAALAPASASAALIVPQAEPPRGAPITPHAVEPAPAGVAQASPSPATAAVPSSSPPSSGGSSSGAAPTSQLPSAAPAQSSPRDPSGDLEADARHHFSGTPDFYARDPVGLIFQVLPMSPPLADQVHAYIDEQRDLLATTDDLATYLDVIGRITDAEEILAYIDGWEPRFSIEVEAEARHRFVLSPDFYQRHPEGAIFSALPTVDQVTSIVDQLRGDLAASSYNSDPEAYFKALRNVARVEEILGRLEEAHAEQGLLETREILGYSEVGDRECPFMDYEFINTDDLRNAAAC